VSNTWCKRTERLLSSSTMSLICVGSDLRICFVWVCLSCQYTAVNAAVDAVLSAAVIAVVIAVVNAAVNAAVSAILDDAVNAAVSG